MRPLLRSVLLLTLAAGWAAAGNAAVRVNFIEPERYTDIGSFSDESRRAMKEIERYLVQLGDRYLSPTASLRVDVLDVDLAGRLVPSVRSGRDIRVESGLADRPKMHLRYVLEDGGRVVADRDETISGPDYLRSSSIRTSTESFPYEKRLLEKWFRENFAGKAGTPR
jgi:Protein of unknown function (DUF3016)